MKKKLLALSFTLALSGLSGSTFAAGDLIAGKSKAESCTGCHGEKGNSTMPLFPKLAGQHPSFFVKQLLDFKDGSRNGPTMAPMAMGLNETDMADIAAYYATQKISANTLPVIDTDDEDEDATDGESASSNESADINDLLEKGSDLYRNGDLEREVSACVACHGPYGEGNKPASYPTLQSQHADYLIKALTDFKTGQRSNNPDNMMHMIAKKMTEEEIKAVSYHISMMK